MKINIVMKVVLQQQKSISKQRASAVGDDRPEVEILIVFIIRAPSVDSLQH